MSEIAFETPEAAFSAVKAMLEDGHYVCMVSREEQLWIVNYLYSDLCDRNDVVFISREDFEEKYCEIREGEDAGL